MTSKEKKSKARVLYVAAAMAAVSAIAYELLLASYATFLLGASLFQYSLVFSLMMASMGVGAWLSEKIQSSCTAFALVEIALCLASLLAIPCLYYFFSQGHGGTPILFFFVVLMGGGIGMEIPLINRLFKRLLQENDKISKILFFDYLGGFIGGFLFPLWLLPHQGFYRAAAIMSVINAAVLLYFLSAFKPETPGMRRLVQWISPLCLLFAITYFFKADTVRVHLEQKLFQIAASK